MKQHVFFNNQRLHAAPGCKSPVQHKTEPGFPLRIHFSCQLFLDR